MSNVLTQNWKENGKAVKGLNQASQDHRVMQHDHHLSTQKIKMLFRMGPPCTSTQSIWVGVPIDHKSLNRMELSGFVYELLHFLLIRAPPVWGWGWVDGMWVYGGALCIHTHTHTHTHTYMLKVIISIANGCLHWQIPGEYPCTHGAPSHSPPDLVDVKTLKIN